MVNSVSDSDFWRDCKEKAKMLMLQKLRKVVDIRLDLYYVAAENLFPSSSVGRVPLRRD